jgi:transcription elongation factor GreA
MPARDGEVEIGERVTVLDLSTGTAIDYRVVGPGRRDPAAEGVSPQSPLGSALLGRHVGDVVEVALHGGTVRLEVVEIDG